MALTVAAAPVATVVVSIASTTVVVGATSAASAVLRDGGGNLLTGRVVAWSSSATAVATVNADGQVTGVAVGTATITAVSEGRSGSATVTVAPAPVATVIVNPTSVSLPVGQTTPLLVTLRDAQQNVVVGRPVSWTTSNQAIASVNTSGTVTGVAPGVATITATSEGRSGTATVTVSSIGVATVTLSSGPITMAVGDVRVLLATARDNAGNVLTGRNAAWFSSNLSIVSGSVSGDTAVITGLQVGAATVTVDIEGRQASVPITVLAPASNVCSIIAGASIVGDDGRYLGRFTNRFDSESVLNEFGQYGSRFAANSTNNEFGTYGSQFGSLSARNPFASRPPVIVKNGSQIGFYTVNEFKTPGVAPAFALTCNFP